MKITLTDGSSLIVTVQKKQVKNITLRVYKNGVVKLTAPSSVPNDVIRNFLQTNIKWVERQIEKNNVTSNEVKENTLRMLGKNYDLRFEQSEKEGVGVVDDTIVVYSSQISNCNKILDNWWRKTSLDCYTKYIEKWFPILEQKGATYPSVKIRKMKSTWGSCTCVKAQIRFSYNLFVAPSACVEYVVLHELAHLLYPNHGQRFKAFLTANMPSWKQRKDILRGEAKYLEQEISL